MTTVFPKGFLMSDGPPSPDRSVSVFLDYVALASIFVCVEGLFTGRPWYLWGSALFVAIVVHNFGLRWPQIKARFGNRLSLPVEAVASKVSGWGRWRKVSAYAALILSMAGFAYRGYIYYHKHWSEPPQPTSVTITMPPAGWLAEWGTVTASDPSGPTVRCVAVVTPLIPYRDKFHLMLIYRRDNKTIDEDEDTEIGKSALFSVGTDNQLAMDTRLANELIFSPTDTRTGTVIVPMRVVLILLPSNTPQSAISKISDVRRRRGDILTRNGFPMTLNRKAILEQRSGRPKPI